MLVRLVSVIVAAFLCGWLMDRLRQPAIVGYILAGVVLGPHFLGLVPYGGGFDLMGQLGLMFLLFFIGSEVQLKQLLSTWKISFVGFFLQIIINVGCCMAIGWFLKWPLPLIIFIAFMISLSSTAVVLKILEEFGALQTTIGRNCLGILLVQDLAVVPMLITLSFFARDPGAGTVLSGQIAGLILVTALMALLTLKKNFHLPSWVLSGKNNDFKVLAGLLFCLGAALLTGLLGLSAELGAFLAGMVLGNLEEGETIKQYIQPFKLFFVCLFFVSIGLLFNVNFFMDNVGTIFLLVLVVLVLNTLTYALILKFLGVDWHTALLTGTMLSQIGEFSFLLAAAALSTKIIGEYGYYMTISVIALTIMFTPLWLTASRKVLKYSTGRGGTGTFKIIKTGS